MQGNVADSDQDLADHGAFVALGTAGDQPTRMLAVAGLLLGGVLCSIWLRETVAYGRWLGGAASGLVAGLIGWSGRTQTRYVVDTTGLTVVVAGTPAHHPWSDVSGLRMCGDHAEVQGGSGWSQRLGGRLRSWRDLAAVIEWRLAPLPELPRVVSPELLSQVLGLAESEPGVPSKGGWVRPTGDGLLVSERRGLRTVGWCQLAMVTYSDPFTTSSSRPRWTIHHQGREIELIGGDAESRRVGLMCLRAAALNAAGHQLPEVHEVTSAALSRIRGDEAEAERGLSRSAEG